MKKFAVLGLAVVLMVAFTMPAMAFDSVFGGYWRTRAYTQTDFTGEDSGAKDLTQVDTRTRLYYTAIFNENFKFVNKFEMNAVWGDRTTYGDIGADGANVVVKNSYADFNLGSVNAKIGVQYLKLARGFLFADDFAGAVFTYKAEAFELPFFWIKAYEGGMGDEANDYDVDYYGIAPKFAMGDAGSIQPFIVYATSADTSLGSAAYSWPSYPGVTIPYGDLEEADVYYLGFDADLNFDPIALWLTGIYQFGSIDDASDDSSDISAWLAAVGAKANFDAMDIHGQIFYVSGQSDAGEDVEFFFPLQGQDYHWSEIMGGGIFDNQVSTCAPSYNKITNIIAGNIGAGFKATEDLKITLDLWYAQLDEAISDDIDEELGTEVDLVVTYKLLEGLNLDLVGAYLFAGESTTLNAENDADPYELGAQLSLSF